MLYILLCYNLIVCLSFDINTRFIINHAGSLRYYDKQSTNLRMNTILDDLIEIPYVGTWNYHYRTRGMQTSTDDVLLAFIASLSHSDHNGDISSIWKDKDRLLPYPCNACRPVGTYIDMGCGIGSTMFLIAYNLKPIQTIGIEVQSESYSICKLTISKLSRKQSIQVFNEDLRCFNQIQCDSQSNVSYSSESSFKSLTKDLYKNCDLITSNPPYLPLPKSMESKILYPNTGIDAQRRNARFEYHGGVEDYIQAVDNLLSESGQYFLSYYSKDSHRVYNAVKNASSLRIRTEIKVLTGGISQSSSIDDLSDSDSIKTNSSNSVLMIFEIVRNNLIINNHETSFDDCPKHLTLDLRFHQGKEAVSASYKRIQSFLNMHPRPLKRKQSFQ